MRGGGGLRERLGALDERLVFVVGCPRSGTTLLRRIADAHPRLAVARGNRWIARTFEQRRSLTPDGLVTPALLERLRDPHRVERLAIDVKQAGRALRDGHELPYSAFVSGLYDSYGDREGKRLVGEKSPSFVRHVPTLHELWPQARYVHLVRDGRDVCLSVLDWGKGATRFSTFRDDPIATVAVWWEWHVRLGREAGGELRPELYDELRYEALVAAPERECARLCGFLGLPYDEAMLRFHEGRQRHDASLDAKRAWRPVTPGLRSWRTQMVREDVARFEAVAGTLLDELGYERGASTVPASQRRRAATLRRRFARELADQKRRLPRAWEAA